MRFERLTVKISLPKAQWNHLWLIQKEEYLRSDWTVENMDISQFNINNAAVYKTAWLVVPHSQPFKPNFLKELF